MWGESQGRANLIRSKTTVIHLHLNFYISINIQRFNLIEFNED